MVCTSVGSMPISFLPIKPLQTPFLAQQLSFKERKTLIYFTQLQKKLAADASVYPILPFLVNQISHSRMPTDVLSTCLAKCQKRKGHWARTTPASGNNEIKQKHPTANRSLSLASKGLQNSDSETEFSSFPSLQKNTRLRSCDEMNLHNFNIATKGTMPQTPETNILTFLVAAM